MIWRQISNFPAVAAAARSIEAFQLGFCCKLTSLLHEAEELVEKLLPLRVVVDFVELKWRRDCEKVSR
jgi:hypothetical protein